jgi:hypothetical protein
MSSVAAFDQASGLRALFADMQGHTGSAPYAAARVMALMSVTRPSLVLPMAQACSLQWRQQQLRHAWIDELDFDAREEWPMPCPVRFDLGQSLADHVPLASALQPFDGRLAWYASARRLSAVPAQSPSLVERLANSGLAFDWVMVCAQPNTPLDPHPWRVFGQALVPVLLCEADALATSQALEWLHQACSRRDGLDLTQTRWVLLGSSPDSTESVQARETLVQGCKAVLGQPPLWLGHAPFEPGQHLGPLLARWQEPARTLLEHLVQP